MVKQLESALDNLAFAPDGMLYVSNLAGNSVQSFDPTSGALRALISGKVAVLAGLKRDADGHTLWISDIFAFRKIDAATG